MRWRRSWLSIWIDYIALHGGKEEEGRKRGERER